MIRVGKLIALLALLGLGACTTGAATPKAVCNALLSPIVYNSVNPKSRRFAGPDLAPDIATHNRVGVNLACPEYKIW